MKNEFQRGNFEAKIKHGKLSLSSTTFYRSFGNKDSPEKEQLTCEVHIEEHSHREDCFMVYVGDVWFNLDDVQYKELLAFFTKLSFTEGDLSHINNDLFGLSVDVVDDYRVGLYFHDKVLSSHVLLDRKFLSHIAEFLYDNNPFKKADA